MEKVINREAEEALANSVEKQHENLDKQKLKSKKNIKEKLIKVEFLNVETPNLALKFCYGSTKRPQNYTLLHGGVYELPEEVIKHLESRGTPLYQYRPDGSGRLAKSIQGYKPRFVLRRL